MVAGAEGETEELGFADAKGKVLYKIIYIYRLYLLIAMFQ